MYICINKDARLAQPDRAPLQTALAGDGKAGIILRIKTSGSSPPPSTKTIQMNRVKEILTPYINGVFDKEPLPYNPVKYGEADGYMFHIYSRPAGPALSSFEYANKELTLRALRESKADKRIVHNNDGTIDFILTWADGSYTSGCYFPGNV